MVYLLSMPHFSLIGRPYVLSRNENAMRPIFVSVVETREFNSKDVVALIREQRLDDYSYSGSGSGCLFWAAAFLRCMESKGYITTEALNNVSSRVQEIRDDRRAELYIPRTAGTFNSNAQLNNPQVAF